MDDSRGVKHVAIIMDGNGRWATAKGLPRSAGHKKGAAVVVDIVEAAADFGVKYLTLFVFSSENWGRPKEEVDYLMNLMREYIKTQFKRLTEENVRIRVIGERQRLPDDLCKMIAEAEETSKDNDGITVNLAVSYSGRADIVRACSNIAAAVKSGDMEPDEIDEKTFSENLYTADTPDPEIVIRTSGEYRVSNFLLWQMAYSEFFFPKKHWPDFTKDDLQDILDNYKLRNRRFGKV